MDEPKIPMKSMHRLFIGVAVTPWLNELMKIQQTLKEKLQNMSRQIIWHPIASLHITLVFIGEVNEKLKIEIENNIRNQFLQTPFPSFAIKATKISLLSHRHIIVSLDAPMLNNLYDKLHLIMPDNEKIKKERAYFAHIALAKLKNPRLARKLYEMLEGIKVNVLQPSQINEFHLYQSKPNRQYNSLASYALINSSEEFINIASKSATINKKWEHFSHDADIGVRGIGETIAESFEMVGMSLIGVITDPNLIESKECISLSCSAPDVEVLLVDFLNAIIFQIETRQMLFAEFHVEINHLILKATLYGESIDRNKHHPAVDVKGATFTELKVEQKNGLWLAQCVIDV